ncbi:hypothetical protein GCM10029963_09130 [Micromonospora andamanensis]
MDGGSGTDLAGDHRGAGASRLDNAYDAARRTWSAVPERVAEEVRCRVGRLGRSNRRPATAGDPTIGCSPGRT